VLSQLPIELAGMAPRIVHALQSVAWGDPPVVLRCGVSRPAQLVAGSSAEIAGFSGVNWLVDLGRTAAVYTLVDRSVYVEVTLPAGTDPSAAMPALSGAIAKALPTAVCYIDTPPVGQLQIPLCTRRS
jgi:Protein of unknown function (DUF3515)